MALDIALVLEVDAVFIAQIIPVRIVGIMRIAHVIDIAPLHEHYVGHHARPGHSVAHLGRCLVAVDALELDGAPVDVEIAALDAELVVLGGGVSDLHLAESRVGGCRLDDLAALVRKPRHEDISPRGFGRPRLHAGHCVAHGERRVLAAEQRSDRRRPRVDGLERRDVLIELYGIELIAHVEILQALLPQVSQACGHPELAVLQMVVDVGDDHQIAYLRLGLGGEVDRADDARHAEHVLCLEKRAVAAAVHLHRYRVVALAEPRRDVKLGQAAGVLGEAHVDAVDPEIEEGVDAVEVDVDTPALRRLGNGEAPAVLPHLIAVFVRRPVFGRHTHHALLPVAHLHLMIERCALVDVHRDAVLAGAVAAYAGHIPRRGNPYPVLHAGHAAVLLEALEPPVGRGGPMEHPFAVEILVIAAVLREHAEHIVGAGE